MTRRSRGSRVTPRGTRPAEVHHTLTPLGAHRAGLSSPDVHPTHGADREVPHRAAVNRVWADISPRFLRGRGRHEGG